MKIVVKELCMFELSLLILLQWLYGVVATLRQLYSFWAESNYCDGPTFNYDGVSLIYVEMTRLIPIAREQMIDWIVPTSWTWCTAISYNWAASMSWLAYCDQFDCLLLWPSDVCLTISIKSLRMRRSAGMMHGFGQCLAAREFAIELPRLVSGGCILRAIICSAGFQSTSWDRIATTNHHDAAL